jgi:hypothetical protein
MERLFDNNLEPSAWEGVAIIGLMWGDVGKESEMIRQLLKRRRKQVLEYAG